MWGPREQHTVTVFGGYMYVIGGYGSTLFSQLSNCGAYACGDMNAGSYRYYHNVISSYYDYFYYDFDYYSNYFYYYYFYFINRIFGEVVMVKFGKL